MRRVSCASTSARSSSRVLPTRGLDRVLGDLVEHHALDRDLRLQHLEQVPRDGLALAVLIGGEQEFVRVLQRALEFGDRLRLAVADDVVGIEVVVDVDRVLAVRRLVRRGDVLLVGQVTDVPDRAEHLEAVAEIALNGPHLRRGLDDDKLLALRHGCVLSSEAHHTHRAEVGDSARSSVAGRVFGWSCTGGGDGREPSVRRRDAHADHESVDAALVQRRPMRGGDARGERARIGLHRDRAAGRIGGGERCGVGGRGHPLRRRAGTADAAPRRARGPPRRRCRRTRAPCRPSAAAASARPPISDSPRSQRPRRSASAPRAARRASRRPPSPSAVQRAAGRPDRHGESAEDPRVGRCGDAHEVVGAADRDRRRGDPRVRHDQPAAPSSPTAEDPRRIGHGILQRHHAQPRPEHADAEQQREHDDGERDRELRGRGAALPTPPRAPEGGPGRGRMRVGRSCHRQRAAHEIGEDPAHLVAAHDDDQ